MIESAKMGVLEGLRYPGNHWQKDCTTKEMGSKVCWRSHSESEVIRWAVEGPSRSEDCGKQTWETQLTF